MNITVSQLLRQLKTLEDMGFGNHKLIYIDELNMIWDISEGIHDNDEEYVVLG